MRARPQSSPKKVPRMTPYPTLSSPSEASVTAIQALASDGQPIGHTSATGTTPPPRPAPPPRAAALAHSHTRHPVPDALQE